MKSIITLVAVIVFSVSSFNLAPHITTPSKIAAANAQRAKERPVEKVTTKAATVVKQPEKAPEPPAPVVVQPVAVAPTRTQAAYVPVGSESEAKAFIYMKESGNNPAAINPSSGACGLGQALPCSKLPCTLQDYACQDNWFSTVYLKRYNFSWVTAKQFWEANHWW